MRNIFLCFLAVILFSPDVLQASGGGRSIQKNNTNNTENIRVATPVRAGAARSSSVVTTRADKSMTRSGADVVSRNTTRAEDSGTRNGNFTNVVSRSGNTHNSVAVNPRNKSGHTDVVSRIKHNTTTETGRGENIDRNVAGRMAVTSNNNKKVTAQEISDAKDVLEQTASLNKSCQEQYNECMDQFCAVVDTNQKRCSCSANLSKYSSVQDAVTKANDELNQVAQRIRYVGLSADEIRAIMTETEAEAELSGKKDTSETRSMLAKIEAMIKDPTTSSSYVSDNDFDFLDLDLDFSDESADIFSLDFLNTESDTISSKRGTALYNAAKKRCKTILNNCTDVGATSSQITGNYDLAIDKDCIAYEQGLKKMNQTLQSNVRSAGLMLQKARLAVLQNKNQYDPKGCMAALDSCMTDEMVCGSGYTKCLDPTKKYIDENGKVVLGQDVTNITKFMSDFNNGMVNNLKLATANTANINETNCNTSPNNDGTCVIKQLLDKIGTGTTVKDGGLCRAVLDKCQQYTYTSSGDKYNPYNDIVVNYVQHAMVNIKSAQQQIISDYASSCMTDVASCYNQQVTQVNSWSSVASISSIKGVMTGACRNVALTCAYAVFANMCTTGETNAINWVPQEEYGTQNPSCAGRCDIDHQSTCIEGISEIFYQSLLCPDNSTYVPLSSTQSCGTSSAAGTNRQIGGCVNTQCRCNIGYTAWNGSCVTSCQSDEIMNGYGNCEKCETGMVPSGGVNGKENNQCVSSSNSGTNSGTSTGTSTSGNDTNGTNTGNSGDSQQVTGSDVVVSPDSDQNLVEEP